MPKIVTSNKNHTPELNWKFPYISGAGYGGQHP
jgi:hypothetical protein